MPMTKITDLQVYHIN